MLASASDAIIIGFNVRPAGNDSLLIKKIDIRHRHQPWPFPSSHPFDLGYQNGTEEGVGGS
jgi:hypothetical protein